ncbi:hypothetical protein [Staphylococcus chromogenes]
MRRYQSGQSHYRDTINRRGNKKQESYYI